MTGPEHYRTAETLLASMRSATRGTPEDASVLAEAQVHATLAVAAAAGLQIRGADATGWEAVAMAAKGGDG